MEETINWFKDMMRSLYAYGGLTPDSRYLVKYKEELGEELFNQVYEEHSKHLRDNFEIEYGTYTDGEGCTYNSLIPKK